MSGFCGPLGQQDVLTNGPPRQQPRLLKHRADPRHRRATPAERSLEVGIETADDTQHRRLAAARWADQRNDLALAESEIDAPRTGNSPESVWKDLRSI